MAIKASEINAAMTAHIIKIITLKGRTVDNKEGPVPITNSIYSEYIIRVSSRAPTPQRNVG